MSRPSRKNAYNTYLNSSTWKRLRQAALERDLGVCRACGGKAVHVHHGHYPRVLGTEKLEWLYSLCIPCHEGIHKIVGSGISLRKATPAVISGAHSIPEKKPRKPRKQRKVRGPRGQRKVTATKGEATMEQILGLKLHMEKRR